jgi:hypothetical protein
VGTVCQFADPAKPLSGYCLKTCMTENDCDSTDAIGCWISLFGGNDKQASVCFSNDDIEEYGVSKTLDCDPTANNGACTFTGSSLPGGCDRQILGSGMAGFCRQGCDIGVGTCPDVPDASSRQNCYFTDFTAGSDGTANPNMDKFKGPICQADVQVQVSSSDMTKHYVPDGSACVDPTDPMMTPFFDICDLGSQCFTYSRMMSTMADNKCHKLCYLNGFTPPNPGQIDDGGVVAMTCATCTDVFGVGSSPTSPTQPIGLCL